VIVVVFLLSICFTVIVAFPFFFAVMFPFTSTVATFVSLEDHVRDLSVALVGLKLIVTFEVLLTFIVRVLLDGEIDVTGTFLTVTVAVAFLFPSAVVTVIVAVPEPTPVTTPDAFTVATFVFELLHVTALLVAVVGLTVAVKATVDFTFSVAFVVLRDTDVTGSTTVMVAAAVLFPSVVLTVIVAVPPLTPVTTPDELTVATAGLELVQVTALLVAVVGFTVAVKVTVDFTFIVAFVVLRDTEVTAMF
jgi:hypothetical protein